MKEDMVYTRSGSRGGRLNIVLLGPQGAGKTTQAQRLKELLYFKHICTGDIIRNGVKSRAFYTLKIKDAIDRGELAPDELVISLVKKYLYNSKKVVFDGFPRTLPQAEALDKIKSIDYVIELQISDEECINRLSKRLLCNKCGVIHRKNNYLELCSCGGSLVKREDDNIEAIKERIRLYHKETRPLLKYYEPRGLVYKVDGSNNVPEVFGGLCRIIGFGRNLL